MKMAKVKTIKKQIEEAQIQTGALRILYSQNRSLRRPSLETIRDLQRRILRVDKALVQLRKDVLGY